MIPSTASHINFPVIKKAEGKYCWDVNGRKYLDFFGANLTVVLGHKQFKFDNPPHFSGKSYLEDEVSKQLSKYTKTKHFRYFKNGHNAVDCAIRLSKNLIGNIFTGLAFIGYGGTSDSYVYTTKNSNGVDYARAKQAILNDGHLTGWAGNLYGTKINILIFESRYSFLAKHIDADIKICDHLKSGINGLYESIDADFHLYGKSIANGYPVAVMTGKDKLMKRIDEIYYSTTFGGDNIGLEAIQETIKEYDREKWLDLKAYADSKLPAWESLNTKHIKKFRDKGILFNGYWNIMTEHTKQDIDLLAHLCKKLL